MVRHRLPNTSLETGTRNLSSPARILLVHYPPTAIQPMSRMTTSTDQQSEQEAWHDYSMWDEERVFKLYTTSIPEMIRLNTRSSDYVNGVEG